MQHRALSWSLALFVVVAGCEGDLRRTNPGALDGGGARDSGAAPSDAAGTDAGPGGGVDAGGGGGTDAGGGCPVAMCGAACVDTATDASNCGACGRACAADQTCAGGMCTGGAGCPGPPAGVSADAAAALDLTNTVRAAMGAPCAAMITEINLASERHCQYYAANTGMCIANPHAEVMGCAMFVGAQFWNRMAAAGYTGSPASEVMAFSSDGRSSVQQWIDSVWHRTPVLSPWVRDLGYGNAARCDTMDFGVGTRTPDTVVATYPYANQTGVPTSFDGRFEGPMPPAPASGWPSGYPIHIYIKGSITTHTFTLDGSDVPIDGIWLAPGDARAMGLLSNEVIFYPNAPMTAGTRYRMRATGTNSAGAVNLDWTFTTR